MKSSRFGSTARRGALIVACGVLAGCASGGATAGSGAGGSVAAMSPQQLVGQGFRPLFDGRDLSAWKIPVGDNGHWKVVDGVIDYDAASEAPGEDKNLWTRDSFGNFVLRMDWKIKEATGIYQMPIVLPDGTHKLDAEGKEIKEGRPNADSGILLRGQSKSQVNMWLWPIGSGEVYGYRTDKSMPPEVRAGVTPKKRADRPVGEWNTFVITMNGDRLTVELNGETVIENAQLPGVPASGPLALQHHGGPKPNPAGSVIQVRNVYIKELP